MISDNPNVSVEIVDCFFNIRRIALKDDYHRKRMDMPVYTPVELNISETHANNITIRARQNQFLKKTCATTLQFVGFLLQ